MSKVIKSFKWQLGGVPWTVNIRDTLADDFGQTHISTKTIDLDGGQSDSELESTLFHEACHAALAMSGISDVINNIQLEEGIVTALESILGPKIKLLSPLNKK